MNQQKKACNLIWTSTSFCYSFNARTVPINIWVEFSKGEYYLSLYNDKCHLKW